MRVARFAACRYMHFGKSFVVQESPQYQIVEDAEVSLDVEVRDVDRQTSALVHRFRDLIAVGKRRVAGVHRFENDIFRRPPTVGHFALPGRMNAVALPHELSFVPDRSTQSAMAETVMRPNGAVDLERTRSASRRQLQ